MLTFTEAIVLEKLADDAKATHEEVAYQDRPNDDEQCSRCWKYRPAVADGTDRGSEPHCLKVADPISPTGWCRRFEIHPDITSFLDIAKGADDQPRDDHGRFASAGGGGEATHPDFMEGHEGSSLAQGMEQVPSDIHDSADAIDSAKDELSSVSDTANDVADEEGDILEEHGAESKEYADWEQRNGKAMEDVADATMKLHAAVTDHLEATLNVHRQLTEIVNNHARLSGTRVGKTMDAKKAKDDGTPVYIVRHGATKLNNHDDTSRDRVRAWGDEPLSDDGREQAREAGEKLKKKVDVEAICASDLSRAEETADIIGKIVGIKPTYSKKLRTWNLGDLAGTPTKEALPKIAKYAEDTPDEAVPGGESFNDFKTRAFEGIAEAIAANKGKNFVLVTHHMVERLISAWIKVGQPASHDIDLKEFLKKGDQPGGFDIVHLDEKALAGKPVKKQSPGASDVHATTALGNEGKRKAMDFLTTIAEIKGGGRIVAVPDTVGDAEVGKEAPPSLKMMDETMAHSPFPHDAHALHNMRPDQVPRFLGALTDQDRLETRTVRLGSLVAMQDRVDPEKVQSMRDTPPGKPPLVIRAGGRNIIADGHHRLAAMHLDGHKTAEVKYMDLSPVDNAVKRYRAVKACPECGVGAGAYHKIGCSGHVLGDVGNASTKAQHEQLATVTEDCPECGAEKGYFHKRDCPNHGKNKSDEVIIEIDDDYITKLINESVARHVATLFDERHIKFAAEHHTDDAKPQGQAYLALTADGDLSLVTKRSNKIENRVQPLKITKVEPDQQKLFGWASVTQIGDEIVVDKQDDVVTEDELEKAADDYVLYHRQQGDLHERVGVGRLIRSMIYNHEMSDLGFKAYDDETGMQKFGWFVGFKVDDPGVWARIKRGDLPELSIGGKAERVQA